MGTQQILMIVLSVIVVGAAVAVGIQMFDTQANNQARNAVVSEISQFGVQAQAWYRTPVMMGGGAGKAAVTTDDVLAITQFIHHGATTTTFTTPSGSYTIAGTGLVITITGTALSNPTIVQRGTIQLQPAANDDSRGISIAPFTAPAGGG
jgi:hypothetical protein